MDENISRAAGAEPRPGARRVELRAIVEPLGRPLEQRTTLYGRTTHRGPPPAAAARAIEADRVAAAASSRSPVTLRRRDERDA